MKLLVNNMKIKRLLIATGVLTLTILVLSCKKEVIDPNQSVQDKMKAAADSIITNTDVPGIVALVVDHKLGIDWMYTAGLGDIPNKLPMDSSYTFRIGSNTKTMTVTVLLQLVGEGKIGLNDKLSKFFPNFPKSDSITIKMLANMTSGIFSYTDDEAWTGLVEENTSRVWLPQELVNAVLADDFYFSPGTGYHYSNTNTIIIGQIIEMITGNPLETEIANRIVEPLNLSTTGFQTAGLDFPGPHARGYTLGMNEELVDNTETFNVSWAWAAGSGYSTPRELQKYVEVLVGGGLLPDSLQTRRMNDLISVGSKTGYGLGILHVGSFYGHNGGIPGFSSSMYHSNEKDCTVIIYYNSQLDLHPDSLFMRFINILYGADY